MGAPDIQLDQILADYGVEARDLQISLELSSEAVRLWRRNQRPIGVKYALEIERKFKIPRYLLRPDLWPPPEKSSRRAGTRRESASV